MGVYEDNEVAPPALLKNLKKKMKMGGAISTYP